MKNKIIMVGQFNSGKEPPLNDELIGYGSELKIVNNNNMGYRSTLVSMDDAGCKMPKWIRDKWGEWFHFDKYTLVSSKCEKKIYDTEFFEDYQKALNEVGYWKDEDDGEGEYSPKFHFVIMSEDGFVTKVIIFKHRLKIIWWLDQKEEMEMSEIWCL